MLKHGCLLTLLALGAHGCGSEPPQPPQKPAAVMAPGRRARESRRHDPAMYH